MPLKEKDEQISDHKNEILLCYICLRKHVLINATFTSSIYISN